MVREAIRQIGAFVNQRTDVVPVPFGIVWLLTAERVNDFETAGV